MKMFYSLKFLLNAVTIFVAVSRPTEQERVALWKEKGNVWPPKWQEESESYKSHQAAREIEIMQLPGSDERWENWMQFTQGQLVPKFTPKGFDVVATPPAVHAKLLDAVNKAIENWDDIPYEHSVKGIYQREGQGEEMGPKFVNIGNLAWEVIQDLKEYHEQWVGGMLRYSLHTKHSVASIFFL